VKYGWHYRPFQSHVLVTDGSGMRANGKRPRSRATAKVRAPESVFWVACAPCRDTETLSAVLFRWSSFHGLSPLASPALLYSIQKPVEKTRYAEPEAAL
jgi:hypothetical protein